MIKKQERPALTILLYIFTVIFLVIFVYYLYLAYDAIRAVKDSGQDVQFKDIINTYISGCSPYLFYSLMCYSAAQLIHSIKK